MTGEITIRVRRDACGEVCWASLEISRTDVSTSRLAGEQSLARRLPSLARALPSLARGLPGLARSSDLAKQFLHHEGIGN